MLRNLFSPRLLKKVQMPGGARCEVRGVLSSYAAAPRERANAADGPFSAACYPFTAPNVSPVTMWRWMMSVRMMTGNVISVAAAARGAQLISS
jgi:hypothetical protein